MSEHSIVGAIGNTPMVELRKLDPIPEARTFAKLEWFNPTGSLKDRIVGFMIEQAEERGDLGPGMTVVEATSGNTGIALSAVASAKGCGALIFMAENMSVERRRIIQALGAEVVLTPAAEGSDGAIARAREAGDRPGHYLLGQFENQDNALAHYRSTAPEILAAVPEVDTFVAAVGTGGTITGVGRRLKEYNPSIRVVSVEVRKGSALQGFKPLEDFVPPVLDLSLIDERVLIDDEDAFAAARELARREGLFVGMSSGAVMHVMREEARRGRRRVVGIFGDSGTKYLSTKLFA